jgi:hypothetical protein
MADLRVWRGDVDVTAHSEMYGVTHGSISVRAIQDGKRHVNLGDGGYFEFSQKQIDWILKYYVDDESDITMSTYDDPVLQNISLMTPEGNKLLLPTDVIFENYNDVKKTLTQCLGKYKNNAFEFPVPADVIQSKILSGEIKNLKKELQFFGTPPATGQLLIDQIIGMCGPGYRMLEPSAGQGALIPLLQDFRPDMEITAIEYGEINYAVLQSMGFNDKVTLIHGDFLATTVEEIGQFDLIIANPPFNKGQEVDHIMHMWKLLKAGGQLISMSSPSFKTNTNKKYTAFKEWLDDREVLSFPVEAGAFKSSGTNIETYIHVLHKYEEEDEEIVEKKEEKKHEVQNNNDQLSLF